MDNLIADYKEYLKKLQTPQKVAKALTEFKKATVEEITSRGYSERNAAYILGISNNAISLWGKREGSK